MTTIKTQSENQREKAQKNFMYLVPIITTISNILLNINKSKSFDFTIPSKIRSANSNQLLIMNTKLYTFTKLGKTVNMYNDKYECFEV